MSVLVSAFYAGLCGVLAVLLANHVLYVRLRSASQPKWRPDAVLRVQANFVENVPLARLLQSHRVVVRHSDNLNSRNTTKRGVQAMPVIASTG